MSALTRTLKSWLGTPATPAAARKARLGMEALEAREVLSAVLADGLLTIKGTTGDDVIRVSQSGDTLRVEERPAGRAATTSTFSAARVSKVLVYGYKGHDSISLYGVDEVAELRGGPGNDSLYGGLRGDTIYGQGDADLVYGNEGGDTLDGGPGNDSLFGYTGDDKLYGRDGEDSLKGGAGDDYLNGGAGNDTIGRGAGTDTVRRSLFIPGPGFGLAGRPPEKDREDEPSDEPVPVDGAPLTETATTASRDSQWHVVQEENPTCSFLAALAAYAERTGDDDDLVQAIKYDAAADKYGVQLYVGGRWTTQWVNGDWTEDRDPGGKLWVTLYEKAYLRAWGVVSRDAAGRALPASQWRSPKGTGWKNAGNALDALTPGYSRWTAAGSAAHATVRAQVYSPATYGMVAASKDSGTADGVLAGHVYMIYDAFTEGGVRKVTLYNPWGIDSAGGALDAENDGLITLTWARFQANFTGYYRNS